VAANTFFVTCQKNTMSLRLSIIFSLFITTVASAQNAVVYFEFNGSGLTNESRRDLDKFLLNKSIRSVGIFGHTDQMGSDEYNEWLSVQRAKVVRDYLLSKGVAQRHIRVVRGFGATRLISDHPDPVSLQMNRRVVITNNYKPSPLDSSIAARQAGLSDTPPPFKPVIDGKKELLASTPVGETKKPVAAPAKPIETKKEVVAVKPATPATAAVSAPAPIIAKREEPIVKQQKNEKLVEDIKDKSTKAGENIVLKNINFHPGSHIFLEAATPALQDLLEAMQKIPTLEIEVQGHVCCQDGETDAIDNATGEVALSVNRAKAVYDYLSEKGISKNRISYKGLAHQFPLIPNEITEEDRVANRRVEIKIIKK
jgi:outer membrane protein OmpA-like peptidoglycan-associated protein